MIDSVTKPKLPKGVSYVLKTSQLEGALADAGIECHIDLVYSGPGAGGAMIEAFYWPPNARVEYPRMYMRAGSVPSASRTAASEALLATALPQLIGWMKKILALPPESPALCDDPHFGAYYIGDEVVITIE